MWLLQPWVQEAAYSNLSDRHCGYAMREALQLNQRTNPCQYQPSQRTLLLWRCWRLKNDCQSLPQWCSDSNSTPRSPDSHPYDDSRTGYLRSHQQDLLTFYQSLMSSAKAQHRVETNGRLLWSGLSHTTPKHCCFGHAGTEIQAAVTGSKVANHN